MDKIVIATTVNATDDPIVQLAKKLGISFFRGSEFNVVGRVTAAMQEAKADIIVQLTADCPLIDPEIIDQLVRIYEANMCGHGVGDGWRSDEIGTFDPIQTGTFDPTEMSVSGIFCDRSER